MSSALTFEPVLPLPTTVLNPSPIPSISNPIPTIPVVSSPSQPSIATALPKLDDTLGVQLIGVVFATFLQGMLTLQLYFYYSNYHKDNYRLKIFVFIVWSLDLIHLALVVHGLYHYTVTNWGVVPALAISTWQVDSHVAVTQITSFLCQSYFIKRLYIISERNWFIMIWPSLGALVSLVLGIVITVQLLQTPLFSSFARTTPEAITLFTFTAATDMLIALLLCFYLARQKTHYKRTQTLVRKVILYTITTGLFTSIIAIASLIEFVVMPMTFVFVITYFSLGSLYTNSLLALLNSRLFLRSAQDKISPLSMEQLSKSSRTLYRDPIQVLVSSTIVNEE